MAKILNKNISWYFNRGIDTLKITALSNHKPGILNNYIRISIFIPVIIIMIKWTTISGYRRIVQEKFEDTKGVIRSRKSKDRQCNCQTKKDKRTNTDLQNITERNTNPTKKTGVNPGAPERLAVPAPHVTPVMLLLSDTNIIWYEYRVRQQHT